MQKVIAVNQIAQVVEKIKGTGEKIILIGGCFDILHPGHGRFLEKAKKLGGRLIVLLESDEFIHKRKSRQVAFKQAERAYILSLLAPVDYIFMLPPLKEDQEYYALVNLIKPDIIAITKNDPLLSIKQDQARGVGAQVIEVITRDIRYSSSKLIGKRKKPHTD